MFVSKMALGCEVAVSAALNRLNILLNGKFPPQLTGSDNDKNAGKYFSALPEAVGTEQKLMYFLETFTSSERSLACFSRPCDDNKLSELYKLNQFSKK